MSDNARESEGSVQPRRRLPLVSALVAIVGLATTVLGLWVLGESAWLRLGASESQIAEYRFGSEAMIAHGGHRYDSLASYTRRGLADGAALAASGIVLGAAGIRLGRAVRTP
jgi:hypothetical protein